MHTGVSTMNRSTSTTFPYLLGLHLTPASSSWPQGAVTQSSFTSGARQLIEHHQACPLTKIGIRVGNSSCAQVCVRECMTMYYARVFELSVQNVQIKPRQLKKLVSSDY